MDTKVFDAERFNKQTSYQDLLIENTALRFLLRGWLKEYGFLVYQPNSKGAKLVAATKEALKCQE